MPTLTALTVFRDFPAHECPCPLSFLFFFEFEFIALTRTTINHQLFTIHMDRLEVFFCLQVP
jgi:hypothetical protein